MNDGPIETDPSGPVLTSSNFFDRHVRLTFDAYQSMDAYISEYLVRADSDGLSATAPVICSTGGDGLPAFIHGLAEDLGGWEGTRSWRSLEDQLRLDAQWHNRGHVVLTWQMQPSMYDLWTVSIEVTLEAGEELKSLGEDLGSFMDEGGSGI